jgi:hypothetical protein
MIRIIEIGRWFENLRCEDFGGDVLLLCIAFTVVVGLLLWVGGIGNG